jgi:hypothetical protein
MKGHEWLQAVTRVVGQARLVACRQRTGEIEFVEEGGGRRSGETDSISPARTLRKSTLRAMSRALSSASDGPFDVGGASDGPFAVGGAGAATAGLCTGAGAGAA